MPKPKPILDKIEKAKIFEVTDNGDLTFTFTEECDRYYDVTLTAEEVLSLVMELAGLVEQALAKRLQ